MILPCPQKPREPCVEGSGTTGWREPGSLNHCLEESLRLIRNTGLSKKQSSILLQHLRFQGTTWHNTFPFLFGIYPQVARAKRVSTLSKPKSILSLRILSWLWVTRDLLPYLESACGGLEGLLEGGIRHTLYARALVPQIYSEHTYHEAICTWWRVGSRVRQSLLPLHPWPLTAMSSLHTWFPRMTWTWRQETGKPISLIFSLQITAFL